MDIYQHRPLLQYESTNRLRLGFVTKTDAQSFIRGPLPKVKELGYSFKTGEKKIEFRDGDNDNESVSSVASAKSTGSRKPASDDKVVFVGVPEFLPHKQLRDLVQRALQSKGIKTKDCTTNFAKLRWSMASIRKPNWPLSAPGAAKIGVDQALQERHGSDHFILLPPGVLADQASRTKEKGLYTKIQSQMDNTKDFI